MNQPIDRQQWLETRRRGIGSSDAAAVCNLSPYGNPLSVYLDKIGQLPPRETPEMSWGTRLEQVIADAYEEETGEGLYAPTQRWNDKLPWMGANVDRTTRNDRIVELKTSRTAQGWGEPGTDQCPESYLVQCQHQMAVFGADVADVAVLIGGSDFRIYTVPRSNELIEKLIQIETDFWNQVQRRIPPPPDWNDPRTVELVALLHRPAPGKSVALDAHHLYLAEQYQRVGADITALEKARAELKAHLIVGMGDAETGLLPDGATIRRKEVTVHHKACEAHETSYFRFTVTQPKEQQL